MITQADIDKLQWFHDFEFPGGLSARSVDRSNSLFQKTRCAFLRSELETIDFSGRAVVDVGCWDGYFSFLAEELGARSVLAVDDFSQNWGTPECFRLASKLKGSKVTLVPDVSVYELHDKIPQQFDIILFLGVYYHLHAPYAAFAQIRHLCHADSLVLIEGACLRNDSQAYAEFHLNDPVGKFIPTTRLLTEMLGACYLQIQRVQFLGDAKLSFKLGLLSQAELLRSVHEATRSGRSESKKQAASTPEDRVFIVAKPFCGRNASHKYKPPFGLERYDLRKWNFGE